MKNRLKKQAERAKERSEEVRELLIQTAEEAGAYALESEPQQADAILQRGLATDVAGVLDPKVQRNFKTPKATS